MTTVTALATTAITAAKRTVVIEGGVEVMGGAIGGGEDGVRAAKAVTMGLTGGMRSKGGTGAAVGAGKVAVNDAKRAAARRGVAAPTARRFFPGLGRRRWLLLL